MNILLTPFKPYRVLAILDFEFSHVGPPSEEYFLSLPFVGREHTIAWKEGAASKLRLISERSRLHRRTRS